MYKDSNFCNLMVVLMEFEAVENVVTNLATYLVYKWGKMLEIFKKPK